MVHEILSVEKILLLALVLATFCDNIGYVFIIRYLFYSRNKLSNTYLQLLATFLNMHLLKTKFYHKSPNIAKKFSDIRFLIFSIMEWRYHSHCFISVKCAKNSKIVNKKIFDVSAYSVNYMHLKNQLREIMKVRTLTIIDFKFIFSDSRKYLEIKIDTDSESNEWECTKCLL